MRKLLFLPLALAVACTTATPPAAVETTPEPPSPHGFTVEEEARILALEDRREYDPTVVAAWVSNPNALHRVRIALALGRIGAHTFIDKNNNGLADVYEPQAGLAELQNLAKDSDRNVREMAAFALGEIGDLDAVNTLFYLCTDDDGGVAAEAAEALSKLAAFKPFVEQHFIRYSWMTKANWPEGVRARAIRYLFRFNTDEASQLAADALADTSTVIRREAAYALSRRALAGATSKLELLVTDPDVLTRAYAAAALGRIAAPSSYGPLVNALGDQHPWVRTNGTVALTKVTTASRETMKPEDLPRVFALLDDADAGVRVNAIDLLRNYATTNATAAKRLLDAAELGSTWIRDVAIAAYVKDKEVARAQLLAEGIDPNGNIGSRYVTTARRLVKGASPWGRARAIEASSPEMPYLVSDSIDDPDPMIRAAAVSSIKAVWLRIFEAPLRKALSDPDVIVRANAIEKYDDLNIDTPDVELKTFKELEVKERTAPQNDARLAALSAIVNSADKETLDLLSSLVKDSDPVVRRMAAESLEKLGKPRPQYTPLPVKKTPAEYAEIVRWSRTPHTATIHMTRGLIEVALLPMDAPMTTWNFAQLAQKKYFDNTSFMRVVPNFVIQGGDPRNDMNGGPGYAIRDEINLQKYTRGAVGMALSGPDTGGSQFFITHSPQPHLDGGYTIFGRVYEGMNSVVDQVERGDRVETIVIDEKPMPGAAAVESSGAIR